MKNKLNYIESKIKEEVLQFDGAEGGYTDDLVASLMPIITQALEEQAAGLEKIIGEDEADHVQNEAIWLQIHARNMLRKEQRERLKEMRGMK